MMCNESDGVKWLISVKYENEKMNDIDLWCEWEIENEKWVKSEWNEMRKKRKMMMKKRRRDMKWSVGWGMMNKVLKNNE